MSINEIAKEAWKN